MRTKFFKLRIPKFYPSGVVANPYTLKLEYKNCIIEVDYIRDLKTKKWYGAMDCWMKSHGQGSPVSIEKRDKNFNTKQECIINYLCDAEEYLDKSDCQSESERKIKDKLLKLVQKKLWELER